MAVVALELPCFWLSMAMGIRMGQALSHGYTAARTMTSSANTTSTICVGGCFSGWGIVNRTGTDL